MEMINYYISGKQKLAEKISFFSKQNKPFLFLIDFDAENGYVIPLSEIVQSDITFSINGEEKGRTLYAQTNKTISKIPSFKILPLSYDIYKKAFDNVQRHLKYGNSYLLNLTFASYVGRDIVLEDVFKSSKAKYKLLFKDKFVFYSPEPFIRISENKIYSYPMKGTIDATEDDACNKLINNEKELYEHYTIVDLIRNDISMVATNVNVDKFRFVEKINTSNGAILQTSSQISGLLPDDWQNNFGEILVKLLPAGSITGAPKVKTVEIIKESESSARGFYTGVMGVKNGNCVDSCVIIRYLERNDNGDFYYRSGGGITSRSDAQEEYNELIEKIYVPTV